MTVTFAEKLVAHARTTRRGLHEDAAPRGRSAPRTSSSSPRTSRPGARTRRWSRRSRGRPRASTATRTSTPASSARRIAERYEIDPARIAVGNGSCEILLAAAEALCEPGDEILYAWPSFSIYPHLRGALGRPGDPGAARRTATSTTSTRCSTEVTAATQLLIVCNPNNPTGDPPAGSSEIAAFVRAACPRARHGHPRRGLHRVPDQRRPRRTARPARASTRTSSCCARSARCYGLAGLRVGYALRLGAVPRGGRRRPPAVQRQRARAGRGGRGAHAPGRRRRAGSSGRSSSGSSSRRGCDELGLDAAGVAGQLLLDRRSATATRPRSSRSLGERGDRGPAPARRSAARAASASPTAPAPRTSASSTRSRELLVSAELLDYSAAPATNFVNEPREHVGLPRPLPSGARSACLRSTTGDLARRPAAAVRGPT